MSAQRSSASVLLVCGLLIPGAAVTAAGIAAGLDDESAGTSPREPVPVESVIESYRSFSLARLGDGTVAAIEGPGDLVQRFPDYGLISLNGVRSDPSAAPAVWLGPGAYIVQTVGPVKPEWREEIEARAAILDYVPHFAYLVWLDSDTLGSLRSALYVRGIAHHQAEHKVALHLQDEITSEATRRSVLVQLYDPSFRIDAEGLARSAGGSLDAAHLRDSPTLPPYRLIKIDGILPEDLPVLVQRRDVIFIDTYEPARTEDEVGTQIIAGNIQGGQPVLGYQAWLAANGIDGTGVIMGHSDGAVGIGHGDFESRVKGPNTSQGGDSHGTHTMSTILGAPIGGGKDSNGFLYGQGVAPKAGGYTVSLGASQAKTTEMSTNGAVGSSNSWNSGTSGGKNYGTDEREQDLFVLDADPGTPGEQPFAQIFSAGNQGSSGLTRPHAAKNLVAVCASENDRGSNIDSKASFSSIGYTQDGRVKPEVCAPGANVWSAQSGTTDQYQPMSGTSMACPHAAGATALVFQWYKREYGTSPSPAMNKAILVNGAMDMVGGNSGDIPNVNEGWGRLHLRTSFGKSTGEKFGHVDGKTLATGDEYVLSAKVNDTSKAFKVTLAWSDAAGASGANPALVNDLDLTVEGSEGAYAGNDFATSWSKTGGTPSKIDNLENVFVRNPTATYTIKVRGTNVPSGPQAFALVVQNSDAGAPSGSIALASPQGGERLKGGASVNVGWTSSGSLQPDSVSLSFSKDGGTTWDPPFASNQPLNGSSQWTVPMVDTVDGMVKAEALISGGGSVKVESGRVTVDSTPPVATARPMPPLTTVAGIDVAFDANDTGTGVGEVEVFYRVGGGSYASAGRTPTSPLRFTAVADGLHEFYASATDAVGNVEAGSTAPEASTLVDLAPPSLLTSTPADGAADIPVDTTVHLTFSESMDRPTVESGTGVAPSAAKGAFVWDASGAKASFTLAKLSLLTLYTISVSGKDLAGRDLPSTSVRFTTSKVPTVPAGVSGKVTEVFTSAPVEGATVTATQGALAWVAGTDLSGSYVMDKLPAGSIMIKVTGAGYADATGRVTLSEGGKAVKDFVLTPPGEPYSLVRGSVVDGTGAAIVGAEVSTEGVPPSTTGTDGKFELKVPAGAYRIEAKLSGMTGVPVDVTVGEWEIKEVTLKLQAVKTFDLMSVSFAGIPLLWLLILIVAIIAAAAVASRARRGDGRCRWCGTAMRRDDPGCPACGAAAVPVAPGGDRMGTGGGPRSQVPPSAPPPPSSPPPPPEPAIVPSLPAGDPAAWDPGKLRD